MQLHRFILAVSVSVLFFASVAAAQSKGSKKAVTKKPLVTSVAPTPVPADEPIVVKSETKKNERPAEESRAGKGAIVSNAAAPTYFYEFAQPDFVISKIVIEHDDAGRGTISFTKKLFGDKVTDPLQVSAAALERINDAYTALQFLDSTESYQYEKDYSHLGVSTFKLKKGGKERTAIFNYTVNKDAKALSDEYRKLGNQFIWMFDISVARENQPLEAPKLLDALEGFLKRNEISDASQMLPLLKSMKDDERVPLIARNHAGKLAERIEKESGKR
ncbi:MAG TPA: hypothetical protein VMZ26_03400 [Pyrinomonadaceae bacterium]|nr:hypothetical protein [Pyrinomonadaceae bacterium]